MKNQKIQKIILIKRYQKSHIRSMVVLVGAKKSGMKDEMLSPARNLRASSNYIKRKKSTTTKSYIFMTVSLEFSHLLEDQTQGRIIVYLTQFSFQSAKNDIDRILAQRKSNWSHVPMISYSRLLELNI